MLVPSAGWWASLPHSSAPASPRTSCLSGQALLPRHVADPLFAPCAHVSLPMRRPLSCIRLHYDKVHADLDLVPSGKALSLSLQGRSQSEVLGFRTVAFLF